MTTDCIDTVHFETADQRLRDTVVGVVVAVIFVIPATLGLLSLL